MGKGIGQALRGFKTAIAEKPQIAESHEINNESLVKK
jgi:hypothetical protein